MRRLFDLSSPVVSGDPADHRDKPLPLNLEQYRDIFFYSCMNVRATTSALLSLALQVLGAGPEDMRNSALLHRGLVCFTKLGRMLGRTGQGGWDQRLTMPAFRGVKGRGEKKKEGEILPAGDPDAQ
jgi:hypothetical protein